MGKGGSYLTLTTIYQTPAAYGHAECPRFISWNWTESELGWEHSLTEWVKGYGDLHPRMPGLKETLKLIKSGSPAMLENIFSIFLPNCHSLSAWICH